MSRLPSLCSCALAELQTEGILKRPRRGLHDLNVAKEHRHKANIVILSVTRTEKHNDRNHTGLADGTATAEDRLPRYFAKSGPDDADPKAIKKQGSGKGNW